MTKPPAEKRVLAWDGKQWVRAIWVEKHTKEQDTDSEFHDYCEACDEYYWPEGWYEVQTHGGDDMFWHITDGVQEWREMPAAPVASDHSEDILEMVSGVDSDTRTLAKWLNEEPNAPIDRQALARVLAHLSTVDEAAMARLRLDLENATESRKLAQQALYDARERFQKEVSARTSEISRLLKESQDCEPFGYFKCTMDGWIDCAETDEGARPLYEAPPKREPMSLDKALLDEIDFQGGDRLGLQKIKGGWRAIPKGCLTAVHHHDLRSALKSALGIGGQS